MNFLSNNSFIFLLIKPFFTHNLEICLPDVLIFVTVFFTSLFFFKRNYFGIFYEKISILDFADLHYCKNFHLLDGVVFNFLIDDQ